MKKVLEVTNLRKSFKRSGFSFKKVEILKDISFEVYSGRITGFLGANGAGKTTTVKCMFDLIYKDSGSVRFFGEDNLTSEIKSRIGFLPERPYFYEHLTGKEFLTFYGSLTKKWLAHELEQKVLRQLHRVGLEQAKDRQLRHYSKGMLQRVGIAQALLHEPEFIVLDEPMTGLDPDGRWQVNEIIKETAHQGTAVFFSSHLLLDAERICQDLVVLKHGLKIYSGTLSGFMGQVDLKYIVKFITPGSPFEAKEVVCNSTEELQTKIDQLRHTGATITHIREDQPTLEEAFVKVAFERSAP